MNIVSFVALGKTMRGPFKIAWMMGWWKPSVGKMAETDGTPGYSMWKWAQREREIK